MGATLAGTVDLVGLAVTDCHFDYGPTAAYGTQAPCAQLPVAVPTPTAVSARLTALAAGTLYHYRLVTTTGAGTSAGADATFRTVAAPRHFKPDPTMVWAFDPHARYTTVSELTADNASVGSAVVLVCRGHGCRFRSRTVTVTARRTCRGRRHHRHCIVSHATTRAVLDLRRIVAHERLAARATLTVRFTRAGYVGKVYTFTMRARRQPASVVDCLAPGSTVPGAGC